MATLSPSLHQSQQTSMSPPASGTIGLIGGSRPPPSRSSNISSSGFGIDSPADYPNESTLRTPKTAIRTKSAKVKLTN